MKRCPECGREYDNTMMFCLDDGAELLYGPAKSEPGAVATGFPADEPQTAILHSTAAPGEAPTRAQINTTDQTAVFPPVSGDAPKRGFDRRLLAVPILLIFIGGAFFGVYKFFSWRKATTGLSSAANMKISRVTSTGKATHAAISPDGNYIVHSMADGGKESVWVRQTATGSNVQIVPPSGVTYRGMTFSPDGNYVYLLAREVGAGTGILSRIPTLGGTAITVIKDVDSEITFSPDGQQIAFVRWNGGHPDSGLWLANADGTNERRLAMRELPEQFFGGPAWSPDGKVIACAMRGTEPAGAYMTVIAVNVSDGDQKAFTQQRWSPVGQSLTAAPSTRSTGRLAWLSNDTLIMNAAEQIGGNNAQLWRISYPDGQAQPLTHDLNDYTDVGLNRDSTALVTVQSETQTNVWLAPDADARRAKQITFGKNGDGERVTWTPDGKIVYDSRTTGNEEIWSVDANGADPRQLTNDPHSDSRPAASPDGRYIVFISGRSGTVQVWRMRPDGSDLKQLTSVDAAVSRATVTPDSQWVIFGGRRVSIDGGVPEKLGIAGPMAQDGRIVAWGIRDDDGIARTTLKVKQPSGDASPVIYEVPQTVSASGNLQWRTDWKAVYYIDTRDGISNIWSYPLDGGQPKQVTNFQSDAIFGFAFSPDGKQLAVTRGSVTNDVVLIKDFR